MLRIYAILVVVVALLAIGSVIVMADRVDRRSGEAAEHAQSAVEAAQIQADLRGPVSALFVALFAFVNSDALDVLPEATREALVQNVVEGLGSGFQTSPIPLPQVRIPLPTLNSFDLESEIAGILAGVDALTGSTGHVDLTEVLVQRDRLASSSAAYMLDDSGTNFRSLFASLILLGEALHESSELMQADLVHSQAAVTAATDLSRWTMIVALSGLAATMLIATLYVARTIHSAFSTNEKERVELRKATTNLQYRNDQLNALYNVFAEITDTISMPFVINAALRETLRVMRASIVTVRLLRGSQLIAAGTLTSEGRELPEMAPIPLGEGPIGRVARRGRSMRIEEQAQEMLGPPPDPNDLTNVAESGVIVPLIVGGRVVGTISCWSREPGAFSEEDERVLEMMASQVATAVAAADTTEMFERRALLDPLTNLPNRRQLAQDVATRLGKMAETNRPAVIGMLDIDHFKRLNDAHGHKVGDVALQKIANVMRNALRETDRIYRYGGEEFIVIFTDTDAETAAAVAQRVLTAVQETPLAGDRQQVLDPVTVSMGIALMPEHGRDFATLIDLADKALYQAKQEGRNRLVVWDPDAVEPELSRIA